MISLNPDVNMNNIDTMVEWLNDPEVVRYSEQRHIKHNHYGQLFYVESFPRGHFLEILLNGKVIGTISARVDKHNGVANLGIMIGDKSQWGKGYGSKAWSLMMDHLFHFEGVRKIEAGCMSANQPMLKIFLKSQMEREGSRRLHFKFGESLVDLEQWMRFADGSLC